MTNILLWVALILLGVSVFMLYGGWAACAAVSAAFLLMPYPVPSK